MNPERKKLFAKVKRTEKLSIFDSPELRPDVPPEAGGG